MASAGSGSGDAGRRVAALRSHLQPQTAPQPLPAAPAAAAPGGLTIGQLCDGAGVTERLVARGMDTGTAAEKLKMFVGAAKRLADEGLPRDAPARAFWVPGRIEVLGKHTDYAGGRSMLAAVSKGFAVVSVDRGDAVCRVFTTFGSERQRAAVELPVSPDLQPQQGHWSAYPATAIRRLARNFGISGGVDIALECDLPESSGMSSSSAVICYMWLALAARNGIANQARFKELLGTEGQLYTYLGFIENGQDCGSTLPGDRGVGTFGGSEDHTGIMSSEHGKVKVFSYCPTRLEGVFAVPDSVSFVIAVSGAKAEKTGGAMADYNNAAFLARDSARAWRDAGGQVSDPFVPGAPNLAEVVRATRGALPRDAAAPAIRRAVREAIAAVDDGRRHAPSEGARPYPAGALTTRFEQFFDESEVIIPAAARALQAGDWAAFGSLCDESHRLTVRQLRNTIPETEWLPQAARRMGALAASAFGAGFGGSCWALVPARDSAQFAEAWRSAYLARFGREKSFFFATRPSTGAFQL
eukprot:TRINITY_DN44277_c0_g1_i1.p1 TRINITY_DN44277_c0_g1~~TRINITY_DN44277_c0_g1_i1.p1  ORF type:complete len:552 (+),score=173.45 TRINITY_DN44277_c0_g1_i1:76-1656(+)